MKKSPILGRFRRKYSKIVNKPKVERTWEGRGGGRDCRRGGQSDGLMPCWYGLVINTDVGLYLPTDSIFNIPWKTRCTP